MPENQGGKLGSGQKNQMRANKKRSSEMEARVREVWLVLFSSPASKKEETIYRNECYL